jgi:hypothetical protein
MRTIDLACSDTILHGKFGLYRYVPYHTSEIPSRFSLLRHHTSNRTSHHMFDVQLSFDCVSSSLLFLLLFHSLVVCFLFSFLLILFVVLCVACEVPHANTHASPSPLKSKMTRRVHGPSPTLMALLPYMPPSPQMPTPMPTCLPMLHYATSHPPCHTTPATPHHTSHTTLHPPHHTTPTTPCHTATPCHVFSPATSMPLPA